MAQFDVKANVGPAVQGVQQIDKAVDNAAKTVDKANKKQYRPLAPGSLQELREAVKLMERMSALSRQMPATGGGNLGEGRGPAAPVSPPSGGGPASGGDPQRRPRGRWSHYGQVGEVGRFAGAFTGGVGGATSTIANEAMAGARGPGGGFSAGGLLRGGLIGAGLFAAFKAGSTVNEGYESAKGKAIDIDALKRAMGDLGQNFKMLSLAADHSAHNLGINSNEAAKLALEYNRASGGFRDANDVKGELRNSVGFARSYGMDPSQSGGFFGSMRYIGGAKDDQSSRRLALMIGETISRTGMNARAGELLAAIQAQAMATNRMSLAAPNTEGYLGAFSGLMGLGVKGMTSDSAFGMMSAANQAMMGMGAAGEASQNFTLQALGRYGTLDPVQASVLSEGGLFGTRRQMFGPDSAYRLRHGDARADALMGSNPDVTNLQASMEHMDRMGYGGSERDDAVKRHFGLRSYNEAMVFSAMKPDQVNGLQGLLQRNRIGMNSLSATGIQSISNIGAARTNSDLGGVFSNLRGTMSPDEIAKVEGARGKGFEAFQDALVQVTALKDQIPTDGSETRKTLKELESATTRVGEMLLSPLNDMRAFMISTAGIGPGAMRTRAIALEKGEIDKEFDARATQTHAEFSAAAAKLGGGVDNLVDTPARRQLIRERDDKLKAIQAARKQRHDAVDGVVAADAAAEAASSVERERHRSVIEEGARKGNVITPISSRGANLMDALIAQESGGRHRVDGKLLRSDRGALGITQIMPDTGKNPGYGVTPLQNDSEQEYRRFGNDYLGAMLEEFDGDRAKALAAYNAGAGNVKKAVAKGGADWMAHMPDQGQTPKYVENILKMTDGDTPLPPGMAARGAGAGGASGTVSEITVHLLQADGKKAANPISIKTVNGVPVSAGAHHGG